jgi:iron complex outermembrane receptor protein
MYHRKVPSFIVSNSSPTRSAFNRKALFIGVASVLAGLSQNVAAQQLEEIIVTAERRELLLQDTPLSVLAFSGEKLEARGVRDMFDLATISPNLDIKGSRGTGNTSPAFQIRGIGAGAGATGERSVGFYVDNVYMPRTTGPVMRVLDVERVEVLRGPQGTLFGRNSTGGAIRVFSKQAGPDKDAYLRVTGGNFDHFDISGMVNVPLSDTLFLRAQAAKLEQDGFVKRGPQMLGSSEDELLRLQLGWHPTDDLTINFGGMYTDSWSDGSPTDMTQFNMNPVCPTNPSQTTFCLQGNYADWVSDFLEQSGQPRLSNNDPRLVRDDFSMPDWCFLDGADPDWDDQCKQWNTARYTQLDMNIEWAINDNLSLTSTTGYSDFTSASVSDWQLLGMEFRPSGVESEVFYQEMQFNFALFDDRIDLIAGANYFSEDSGTPREALYQAIGSSVFNATTGGTAFGNLWGCAGSGTTPPLCSSTARRLRVTGDGSSAQEATAYGIFANGTIHFTDQWNLTLGVRQSWDEKDFSSTLFASDNFIPQNGVATTLNENDDWSEIDWRATLDYHITEDVMLFATTSKAFRSGTFTVPAALAPSGTRTYSLRPPLAAVPPENLKNNEIGIRSDWFDGRLRINATYYRMDFTNRQGASAVVDATAPTGFAIQLVNQGDVDLWGTEVEAMLAVTDRLTLEAAAGRADYELDNVCINNGPYLLPSPMESSFTLSGRYEFPVSYGSYLLTVSQASTGPMQTHPGGFTAEEQARYGCSGFAATFIDSRYEVPSYDLLNASLRFTDDSGKWTATLYGNNLTDETYANNAQSFGRGYWTQGGPAGGAGLSAPARSAVADYRGRPREYGLTVQYNFY